MSVCACNQVYRRIEYVTARLHRQVTFALPQLGLCLRSRVVFGSARVAAVASPVGGIASVRVTVLCCESFAGSIVEARVRWIL